MPQRKPRPLELEWLEDRRLLSGLQFLVPKPVLLIPVPDPVSALESPVNPVGVISSVLAPPPAGPVSSAGIVADSVTPPSIAPDPLSTGSPIGGALGTILGPAENSVNNTLAPLVPITTALNPVLAPLGAMVDNVVAPLNPVISTVGQVLTPLSSTVYTVLSPLSPIVDTVAAPLAPVLRTTGELLTPVTSTVGTILVPVVSAGGDVLAPVTSLTTAAPASTVETVLAPVPSSPDTLTTPVETIVAPVVELTGPKVKTVAAPVTAVVETQVTPAGTINSPIGGGAFTVGTLPSATSITDPLLLSAPTIVHNSQEPANQPNTFLRAPVADSGAPSKGLDNGDLPDTAQPGAGDLEIPHLGGDGLPSLKPEAIDRVFASTFPGTEGGEVKTIRHASREQTFPVHSGRQVLKTVNLTWADGDLLAGFLSLDQGGLDMEIQRFLDSLKELGRKMAGSPLGMGLFFWILATATALIAYEVKYRRRSAEGQPGVPVVCEGATSTWFPGFPTI